MIVSLAFLFVLFGRGMATTTSLCECQPTIPVDDATKIVTEYVYTEFGTFKIHNSRASWNEARNICLDESAKLTVIDSASKEALLIKYMKANRMTNTWIGVHSMFGKNQWTTIHGDRLHSLDYVHWGKGEPNGAGAGENCVEMNLNGMNDLACESSMGFICEKSGIDVRLS